jgi:predicted nucleic acid-binding protein
MAAILIDTNVLVYAHDLGEYAKQAQAFRVLEYLEVNRVGRLSVQSLSEFFSITTRGSQPKLTLAEATYQVEQFVQIWPIIDLTAPIILEAARGVRTHRLSYYDSQIWAAAHLNQIQVIFSEDFASGTTLEGVRFVNPFAADFVLEAWG